MRPSDDTPSFVADLLEAYARAPTYEEKLGLTHELLSRYQKERHGNVRGVFLRLVQNTPELLSDEKVARFLVDCVEPEDFEAYKLGAPGKVVTFHEMLRGFSYDDSELSEKLTEHAHALLRRTLQTYEKKRDKEKLSELVRLAPAGVISRDPELERLRHQVYFNEVRAAARRRRLLHTYLIV